MSAVIYQEPYAASTRGDHWGTRNAARAAMGLGPHRGMDWAPGDVPALAIADGVVAGRWALANSRVLGNVLVLKHADGLFSGYCHLAKLPGLAVGTRVARHHSIGSNLGSTGSAASGRHLHLTLGRTLQAVFYGETIDPLKWILAHTTALKPAAKPSTGDHRKSTTARKGEGLYAIADRTHVSFSTIARLNAKASPAPRYPVALGQTIWLS